jgi:hypothetical protein
MQNFGFAKILFHLAKGDRSHYAFTAPAVSPDTM